MRIGPKGETGVEVSRVGRDFFSYPRWNGYGLIFMVKFDFRHDETCVFAVEYINLPGEALVFDVMTRLFDSITNAVALDDFLCLFQGNRLLEFVALEVIGCLFDVDFGVAIH